jgi:hypothetical protein
MGTVGTKELWTERSSGKGIVEVYVFKLSGRGQQVIVARDRGRYQ